jgi:hypothetical protein
MAKKDKGVDTTEVPTTQQVLKEGTDQVGAVLDEDGNETETRTVKTTEAVFQKVEEVEGDKERGAHQAVFAEGEPREAEDERTHL